MNPVLDIYLGLECLNPLRMLASPGCQGSSVRLSVWVAITFAVRHLCQTVVIKQNTRTQFMCLPDSTSLDCSRDSSIDGPNKWPTLLLMQTMHSQAKALRVLQWRNQRLYEFCNEARSPCWQPPLPARAGACRRTGLSAFQAY
eukprot:jgi/Botrbrau1/5946/Bobra.0366s0116.1